MVRLLAECEGLANGDKMRLIIHSAKPKDLGRLVSLVISADEVANSCGQGIYKSGTSDSVDRATLA